MYVYMYVCVCVYTYVYIHIFILPTGLRGQEVFAYLQATMPMPPCSIQHTHAHTPPPTTPPPLHTHSHVVYDHTNADVFSASKQHTLGAAHCPCLLNPTPNTLNCNAN